MKIKYVGPFDEVEIPSIGVSVKRGEVFDAPAPTASDLLKQTENFTPVKAANNDNSKGA